MALYCKELVRFMETNIYIIGDSMDKFASPSFALKKGTP
jgi:hypothetical protein